MFTFGANVTWESNLFRLPGGDDPLITQGPVATRSDRVLSYYAGIRIDKAYAQQRFLLDVTPTVYRHDNNTHLDFEALNFRSAWNFHLTPRLSGTLSADQSESLVNYADFRNIRQRNVQTTQNLAARLDFLMGGGWHVEGGLSRHDSQTETPIADEGSFESAAADAGIRYVAGTGSSLGLFLRTIDGDYDDPVVPALFLGDSFQRDELELAGNWVVTARSSLSGRLAYVNYKEHPFSERDFSGPEGRLAWSWTPTGRLSFTLGAAHTLSPWRDASAIYRSADSFNFGAGWEVAARTTLTAGASYVRSRFHEPIVAPPEERRDYEREFRLGASWRVLRNATLTASLQRLERDSTLLRNDYTANVGSLGASISF